MAKELRILMEGAGARIAVVGGAESERRAQDFLGMLQKEQPRLDSKMRALFGLVAERGPQNIRNREKVKALGGGLYEFKVHQVRIFWFYGPACYGKRTVILLDGVLKKRNRHKEADLKRAGRLKQETEGYMR